MIQKRVLYLTGNKTVEEYIHKSKSLFVYNWKGLKFTVYRKFTDFRKDMSRKVFNSEKMLDRFLEDEARLEKFLNK